MKILRTITTVLFIPLSVLLRPIVVQRCLRKVGVRFPYFLSKYMPYDAVVDFDVDGKTLYMQSYNTPIEMTIFWKGVFSGREGSELFLWNKLCKKSFVALDIGANSGVYSLIAAGSVEHVHAFEPVPVVYSILEENITLNTFTNIKTHPEVVGDSDGPVTLYIPKQGWVDVASIDKKFANKYATDADMQEITCTSTTVDTFLGSLPYGDQLIVAKVDVEGAETQVIKGMSQTLLSSKIIVLAELLNEEAFTEVVDLLPENYVVYGVVDRIPHTQETQKYVKGIKNYLLVPKVLFAELGL